MATELRNSIEQPQDDGTVSSVTVTTCEADYEDVWVDIAKRGQDTPENRVDILERIHRQRLKLESLPADHRSRAKAHILTSDYAMRNPHVVSVTIEKAIRATV